MLYVIIPLILKQNCESQDITMSFFFLKLIVISHSIPSHYLIRRVLERHLCGNNRIILRPYTLQAPSVFFLDCFILNEALSSSSVDIKTHIPLLRQLQANIHFHSLYFYLKDLFQIFWINVDSIHLNLHYSNYDCRKAVVWCSTCTETRKNSRYLSSLVNG